MPDAVQVNIAKQLVTLIEAGSYSQSDFVVERSYADWDIDLKDTENLAIVEADKLRVDVVVHTTTQTAALASRGSIGYTVPVDVAIRRLMGADKKDNTTGRVLIAEVDALVLFVEELHVELTKARTGDALDAVWQGVEIVANPITAHLRELYQFTAVLRLTFSAKVDL